MVYESLTNGIQTLPGTDQTFLATLSTEGDHSLQVTTGSQMLNGRFNHSSVVMKGENNSERVFVAGGQNGSFYLNSVEEYWGSHWVSRGAMKSARSEFGLVELEGRLWAVGGWAEQGILANPSIESYDPS